MERRERHSHFSNRASRPHTSRPRSLGPCNQKAIPDGVTTEGLTSISKTSVNQTSRSASLIAEHNRFAESLVMRIMTEFKLASSDRDDLMGAAYLGLVEAAERFDPSNGASFKTFSFLRIRGAIIDYIRDNAVVPHALNQRIKAFVAASNLRESISLEQGGLSLVEKQRVVVELIGDYALIMRLSMESSAIVNKPDPRLGPDEVLDKEMRGSTLRGLIQKLSPAERLVITQYYLEDKNFSEIVGLRRGFTKSWVSRLHRRGLESLRKLILSTNDGLGEEISRKLINSSPKGPGKNTGLKHYKEQITKIKKKPINKNSSITAERLDDRQKSYMDDFTPQRVTGNERRAPGLARDPGRKKAKRSEVGIRKRGPIRKSGGTKRNAMLVEMD